MLWDHREYNNALQTNKGKDESQIVRFAWNFGYNLNLW